MRVTDVRRITGLNLHFQRPQLIYRNEYNRLPEYDAMYPWSNLHGQ